MNQTDRKDLRYTDEAQILLPSSSGGYRLGTGFLLLALFSGLLGGVLALPAFHGLSARAGLSVGMVASHALLLSFFVICPAIFGGIAQWLLPRLLGASQMSLPACSRMAWLLMVPAVLVLPLYPVTGLALWGVAMIFLSLDIIATILEGRSIPFTHLAPFIWAMLWAACSILFIVPVLLALLMRGKTISFILSQIAVPELSLILLPALGLVSLPVLSSGSENPAREAVLWRYAPCLLGISALVAPVLWIARLFGEFTDSLMAPAILVAQIMPGLCFLILLCRMAWCYTSEWKSTSFWGGMAVVLLGSGLICCAAQLCGVAPGFFGPSAMFWEGDFHAQPGHQLVIFGSVSAVSVGFYAWIQIYLLAGNSAGKASFDHYGLVHAVITASGIFLSSVIVPVLPYLAVWSGIVMMLSLFCFMLTGGVAACLLWRRRSRENGFSSFSTLQ